MWVRARSRKEPLFGNLQELSNLWICHERRQSSVHCTHLWIWSSFMRQLPEERLLSLLSEAGR
jgi:hypothetical protein